MTKKPSSSKADSSDKRITKKDPDPELTPDEVEKFKYLRDNYLFAEAFLFEQLCLLRKRLNTLATFTNSLLDSSKNLEQVNESLSKSSRRLERMTRITVVALFVALFVSGYGVWITQNIYFEANRPSNLVVDLYSEKGRFDDLENRYRLGGPPLSRPDTIRISIWNTGAKVAENVTVSVSFRPQNASLYDIHSLSLCREQFCVSKGSPAQIRAIEPNGFYKVNVSIEVFASALSASGNNLYLSIDVIDPSAQHNPSYRYKVEV